MILTKNNIGWLARIRGLDKSTKTDWLQITSVFKDLSSPNFISITYRYWNQEGKLERKTYGAHSSDVFSIASMESTAVSISEKEGLEVINLHLSHELKVIDIHSRLSMGYLKDWLS